MVINIIVAIIFIFITIFALNILIKHLIIKNKCKRKLMIMFYVSSIIDLATRSVQCILLIAIIVDMETNTAFQDWSAFVSGLAGVFHGANLLTLIIGLNQMNTSV